MLRVLVMLGVLGMTTLVLADPPAAPVEADLDRLQGTWMPLQCEVEGKAQMPDKLKEQVRVVFDKNEYHLYFKDSKLDKDGKPIVLRLALANVSLDSTTSPKTIQFEFADGQLKGKKCHGIYEVVGNQLRMCYGSADKPKPTKFESPVGSGYFVETWVRFEKK